MFQRFTVVMEYEQKPVLPPPFIIFCHIFLLLKYLKRKIKGVRETYDNGLKLFLEKDDLERLYDFEEECVEGYFREKEGKLQQSTDERIKQTNERVENLSQKIEDIYQKENSQQTALQSVEFRLRKIEEVAEQTLSHLAVIHRFMATHTQDIEIPEIKVAVERLRKTSERSEGMSETDSHLSVHHPRRRPTRSLTEVRSDAYIFDDGLHFEVRPVEEEDELSETIDPTPTMPETKPKLNLNGKQKSTESKNSLLEESDDDVLMEESEDIGLSIESLRLNRSLCRRRDSTGTGRRSSEGGTSDRVSQRPSLSRRQLSQTHSEPDNTDSSVHIIFPQRATTVERAVTWAEPKIKVIPPGTAVPASSGRSMLLSMHAEYTSITDELETVCGLLSPPRTPRLLSPPRPGQTAPQTTSQRRRHTSEMSNPEIALYLEKEHLRDAEESDYLLMENLIQRRYEEDDEYDEHMTNPCLLSVVHENREFRSSNPKSLRRSSAIEIGDLPTPMQCPPDFPFGSTEKPDDHSSIDNLLLPSTSNDHYGETRRQNSGDTNQTTTSSELTRIMSTCEQLPPRPSIIMDSSQLPIQRELNKADSKGSLHMQSETMC